MTLNEMNTTELTAVAQNKELPAEERVAAMDLLSEKVVHVEATTSTEKIAAGLKELGEKG